MQQKGRLVFPCLRYPPNYTAALDNPEKCGLSLDWKERKELGADFGLGGFEKVGVARKLDFVVGSWGKRLTDNKRSLSTSRPDEYWHELGTQIFLFFPGIGLPAEN